MTIGVMVTDRHKQINKWLQETHPDISHYYDIWHVAKGHFYLIVTALHYFVKCTLTGLRKKLEALAKQKD